LQVILHDESSSFRVERVRILFDQRLREVVDVLGQTIVKIFNDLQDLVRLLP